jgi:poly(beta-D-mannuronate) lyase
VIALRLSRRHLVGAGAAVAALALAAGPAWAARTVVRTPEQFQTAVKAAQPGDVIVLARGEWRDFQPVFRGKGLPGRPVELTVEEKGKTLLTGRSSLRMAGEHLLVSGLVFTNGWTPNGEVIAFRGKDGEVANNSRVTEVVIDRFNNPVKTESDHWVAIYGRGNRFDHSHIAGKANLGATLVVVRDKKHGLENHARIDHNYFGPRPNLGSNGGETIRVGTSHESLSDSHTVVEDNYFDRCDGEAEIISNKSGANIFRRNVFWESHGTLTLRHGNGNLVEDNVFFGNGKAHAGGVRVINRDQIVRNNYMEGLRGSGFTSALTVMNGVPNSSLNRYHQVANTVIENNSIIESDPVHLAAGADAERSAPPISTRFARNLIVNKGAKDIFRIEDKLDGITFVGNVRSPVEKPQLTQGFQVRRLELKRAANGLLYPVGLEGVGVSRSLQPIAKAATGVSWWPKENAQATLGSGKVRAVRPGEGALAAAVKAAGPGDTLALAPGRYLVDEILTVDKPLSLTGPAARRGEPAWRSPVEITFSRPTLFQIEDGGSLRLSRVSISGREAPDAAGNAVIRTSPRGMISAYELRIEQSRVGDLKVNNAFNVVAASKSSLADQVVVKDSLFEGITGAVLKLDAETEDLGLYNAEQVEITGSEFRSVDGPVLNLYRGGTDESTFGPKLVMKDNLIQSSGRSSRNTLGASVRLHGVQEAALRSNRFVDSAPVKVTHTVGEPATEISGNSFDRTPAPVVEELIFKGPHRAKLAMNRVSPQ